MTDDLIAQQEKLWDARAAQRYDSPGEGMFAPELLEATTARLEHLAEGGRALEFAIGTGRVAIPLQARGVPVTGIEISRHMIARLREKVDEATIPVVHGSMTDTRAEGDFSLVYLVFNTIGNVLTQDAQIEVFRNAAAHLSPGGRFVVELEVPQVRRIPVDSDAFVFGHTDSYVGIDFYDTVNQLLVSHHLTWQPEGHEATHSHTPQRYIWPSEMDLMARLTGFRLEQRHSDWDQSPFVGTSPKHISVYRLEQR